MSLIPTFPVAPESAPFKVSPNTYLRLALSGAKGRVFIIVPAALVAGFIVIGFALSDLRFILVAMIVLFIAVPMIMAIGYFSITLSPESTRSTLIHSVELCPDGSLRIVYHPLDGNEPTMVPFPEEVIPPSQIKGFDISGDFIVYRLLSGMLVIIPINSINLPAGWHCHFRDFD